MPTKKLVGDDRARVAEEIRRASGNFLAPEFLARRAGDARVQRAREDAAVDALHGGTKHIIRSPIAEREASLLAAALPADYVPPPPRTSRQRPPRPKTAPVPSETSQQSDALPPSPSETPERSNALVGKSTLHIGSTVLVLSTGKEPRHNDRGRAARLGYVGQIHALKRTVAKAQQQISQLERDTAFVGSSLPSDMDAGTPQLAGLSSTLFGELTGVRAHLAGIERAITRMLQTPLLADASSARKAFGNTSAEPRGDSGLGAAGQGAQGQGLWQ